MALDANSIMLANRDVNLRSAHDILHAASALNRTDAYTLNLISNLVLAESKLVRNSTIVLASFNTFAAFITAVSIIYDCYWASKRSSVNYKASKFCLSAIHPAETFSLILAVVIVIQGLIFAGAQGTGLKTLYTDGCAIIAQIVWPAIFFVPYIQLVFGIECLLRSFRSIPFQARGKHDVKICLFVVVLMLIATWLPTHFDKQPDTCFASLLWFVSEFGKLGMILISTTAGSMIICALIIYHRLSAVNFIDQHQRIAASRIVHHLIVGTVSLTFVLPFFVTLLHEHGSSKLSMMATVMLNISGLLNGLLRLVLRSNISTTSIGPKTGAPWDQRKHEIRIFGPNELALYNPLFDPVPGPATISSRNFRTSNNRSDYHQIDMEKFSISSYSEKDHLIGVTPKMPTRQNTAPVSYSLFPPQDSCQTDSQQRESSLFDTRDLDMPLPTFARNSRHFRNSSDSSIATVQIGLRLSQAPIENMLDGDGFRLPATTYNARLGGAPLSRSPLSPQSPQSPLSPKHLKPNTYSSIRLSPDVYKPEKIMSVHENLSSDHAKF